MSTYLKTAAMSLLSKTLQTFLYKYLSDVDVEGVALPSVYDGSGWGVRLSNVQLREGVELMKELPGKVTKRRKRKRKIRKAIPRRKQRPERHSKTGQLKQEPFLQRSGKNDDGTIINKNNKNDKDPLDNDKHTQRTISKDKQESFEEPISNTRTETLERETFYSTDEEYDSDTAVARPTTPVQESKSMFSCFYNSRGSKKMNDHSLHANSKTIQKKTSEPESLQATSATRTHTLKRQLSVPLPSSTSMNHSQYHLHNQTLTENSDDDDGYEGYDCDNSQDFDYEDEEEVYEEDCEVPLRLCLGQNGYIGTLDVRLIGKELHVMVEDAVVTIEAVPVLPTDDGASTDSDQDASNTKNQEGHDKKSTEEGDAAPPAAAKKKKTEHKRDTVGDRVLADNPLARLISAIPHLFLRDIRIRLIIRDKPMTVSELDTDDGTNRVKTPEGTTPQPECSPKDIMIELGIDFLSVSSGEDILSHFQQVTEEESQSASLDPTSSETFGERSSQPPTLLNIPSYTNVGLDGRDQKNEFLVRHIRTGRGPAAGIFLQVFAPSPKLPKGLSRHSSVVGENRSPLLWARQRWMASTENFFLRCSGLDVQARIHMGTRAADVVGYSWFGDLADEDDGSDYDSMLLLAGMDTVAPGPQLPLPPMEPQMNRGGTLDGKGGGLDQSSEKTEVETFVPGAMHPGAEVYQTDKNGIQSCKVPSTFHRVSRGMEPGSCKNCKHIPSEICHLCWQSTSPETPMESPLDSSMPMPGLVLHIGVRDPLELNVDRESVESLGLLKSVFTRPTNKTDPDETKTDSETSASTRPTVQTPVAAENTTQTTSTSTGFFSSMIYGTPVEEVKIEEPSEAFETYMQPENITVIGIHASEIQLRVHIMKENRQDGGMSFAYWDLGIDCLTLDRHTLISEEKTYQDLQFDIGRIHCDEYCGVQRKNICTLGLKLGPTNRGRCDSQTSAASMMEDHEKIRAPWPSTACALLDIPPPLESLVYKSRERHGLQLRFVSLSATTDGALHAKSSVHARLGVTTVNTPLGVRFDFVRVINEILDNLVRGRQRSINDTPAKDEEKEKDTETSRGQSEDSARDKVWMSYTVQIDSGDIKLPPSINLKLPLTRFCGEKSSLTGISFESALDKIDVAYGSTQPQTEGQCLTLPQMSELPERVRMHILLCLPDLTPLEEALGVKKEKNPFRRIKTIDKAMLKVAKKVAKRVSKASNKKAELSVSDHSRHGRVGFGNRRQLLGEIMKLDDAELSELWSVHQRYKKKLAKKRGEV
ncbi:hypothetical protein IV203_026028 [Nitzschia inconspicua]|nr:hypothetical protein IV203_026028 [Nitzschia inconspicua]